MAIDTQQPAAPNDDKRELYTLVREDRERIAALEGAVDQLTSKVEQGFRNIQSSSDRDYQNIVARIDSLSTAQAAARPQLGIISTIIIAACMLVGGIASFALKSSVLPLQHDFVSLERRMGNVEDEARVRTSDADDAQDARIASNERVIQEFNRLMLWKYVSGSIGAAEAVENIRE